MKEKKLEIFRITSSDIQKRPIVNEDIAAGFPSPAEDFQELRISLDKELIKNENATFYARVRGNSMIDANIEDGDLLVIDRSIEAREGKVAVCMIDGEFTVKRIKMGENCLYLIPENNKFPSIKVTEENEFVIWGIVTYVIKEL